MQVAKHDKVGVVTFMLGPGLYACIKRNDAVLGQYGPYGNVTWDATDSYLLVGLKEEVDAEVKRLTAKVEVNDVSKSA